MADFADQRTRLFERIDMAMVENMADDQIQKLLHDLFAGQAAWARCRWAGRSAAGGRWRRSRRTSPRWRCSTSRALAAVDGVVFGVVMVVGNARRVIEAYRTQMDAKREELTQAIGDLIRQAIDVFYQKAGAGVSTAGNVLQRAGGTLSAGAGTGGRPGKELPEDRRAACRRRRAEEL